MTLFLDRRRIVRLALIAAGAALCAIPCRNALVEWNTKRNARRLWEHSRKGHADSPAAAWLRVPSCRLDTIVLKEGTSENLLRAPCLESIGGLTLVSAHRDKHFRSLSHLRVGDAVELERPTGQTRRFRVVELEVLPRERLEARLLDRRAEGWLALVTCHPFRYVGPAPDRFLAWAHPSP